MNFLGKAFLVIVGAMLAIIGVCALMFPMETFVSMAWIWAIMTIVGGIGLIAFFFIGGKDMPGGGLVLFGGIVQLILGVILVSNGTVFTTIVALNVLQIWIIFSGIESIIFCIEEKRAGVNTWWATLIFGIACLLIGLSSVSSAVFNTAMMSFAVGFGLILSGAGLIVRAFGKKSE